MSVTRHELVTLAIAQRNQAHLFLDRKAYVQSTIALANTLAGLNPRFRFDTFFGETGIMADEYRMHGTMCGPDIAYPTTTVRPCPSPKRSHRKAVSA